MRDVEKSWPSLADARHLGKRIDRIDGPVKVTGRAKYTFDVNRPNMLWAKFTLCPHGKAKVLSVDVSEATRVPGVVVAKELPLPGDATCHWHGFEVAVVAAETEEAAREGARRVKVEYEVLPHNVVDDTTDVGDWVDEGRSREQGEVDEAFASADVTVEGEYGCPIITHCCLESHGSVVEAKGDAKLEVWPSTQRISSIGNDFANELGLDPKDVHADCQHLGGGFGSKFGFDVWDKACAAIAEETGRPVKAMLERDHEIMVAGSRPSAYAKVKVAARKDGTLTGFDFESWGSGGPSRSGALRMPYVFTEVPHRRVHSNVRTNTGPNRAWRAPGHPQMAWLTMAAVEDAAAALGLDPLELFRRNLAATDRPDVYAEELDVAAGLIGWKEKWEPRSAKKGVVRRGLGLSIHTWGGRGHDSNARTTIHSDGRVDVECGTQDLGVGTRTVLAICVAETLGLPVEAVRVHIGDNRLPPSGASGGSTTVGGISSSSRTSAVDAVNQLIARVAPDLEASAEECAAAGGRIFVRSDPARGVAWAEACALIGQDPIVGNGRTDPELMNSGVGGVQMSEVEVDVETGVATMVKHVAVQDCGTIVDLETAESQVYGACIMGITSALFEERVMDPVTGRCLNPDMEFYRLAGIGDVGELVVHMMQTDAHHGRGVIGLGEPPVISPLAAIGNAVANACGVRVPRAPFTPRNVLSALAKGAAR